MTPQIMLIHLASHSSDMGSDPPLRPLWLSCCSAMMNRTSGPGEQWGKMLEYCSYSYSFVSLLYLITDTSYTWLDSQSRDIQTTPGGDLKITDFFFCAVWKTCYGEDATPLSSSVAGGALAFFIHLYENKWTAETSMSQTLIKMRLQKHLMICTSLSASFFLFLFSLSII